MRDTSVAWSKFDEGAYMGMLARHVHLWSFINRFIREFRIESCLEVGGGVSPVLEWIQPGMRYRGVDINPNAVELARKSYPERDLLAGDWTDNGQKCEPDWVPDLFLSCATVEHCRHYRPFLARALRTNPRFLIVSFFRGLDRPNNLFHEQRDAEGNFRYYLNMYSGAKLMDWVRAEFDGVFLVYNLPSANRNRKTEGVLVGNLRDFVPDFAERVGRMGLLERMDYTPEVEQSPEVGGRRQ